MEPETYIAKFLLQGGDAVGSPLNPGPPLKPEEEFCDCQPPGGLDYLRAGGAAFLTILAGGAAWLGVSLAIRQVSGFSAVIIGVGAGWLIHRAAARRRSTAIGAIASAATVLAAATGYALSWLPVFQSIIADRAFSWYDLIMAGLGAFVAYRLAGPSSGTKTL